MPKIEATSNNPNIPIVEFRIKREVSLRNPTGLNWIKLFAADTGVSKFSKIFEKPI